MRFLFPQFLFAFFAVAIPILIHLFNFRKFKKVYFSNVKFLKEIEIQTSSSKNVQRLLVLIARILAIVFLVFAFAKPFIPAKDSGANAGNQVVSVFIDNSYSMETVNKEGTLLDEAKRRAKEIASAYSLNDKFQLLTNNFEGKHQRLLNFEDFNSAVDEVKISSLSRTLPQIIRKQKDVFTSEPNSRKTAYIISDFQNNLLGKEKARPDSGITLRLVRLEANQLANVSVDSVWFTSPIHKPNETEKLVVRLRNNSDKKAESIPVKLTINNQQKALASLTIEPRGTNSDTLSFSGLGAGWQQGQIQITDYPVVFDDDFYFTFNVKQSLPVLAISEKAFNPYLQAVYRSDPFFKLNTTDVGSINYSGLSSYPLIIMNEIGEISSGLSQQLKSYVSNGGNLMIFPTLTADLTSLTQLLQSLGTDIPQGIVQQEAKVTSINIRHPLFADVFERIPQKLDLPVAKKYLNYSNQSRTTRQAVLDFAGGKSFFSQYKLGKGNVYLSAVPLNDEASNFVRHSVFVPIMYNAALLSLHDNRLYYTLGRDQFLETEKTTLPANQTFTLRKGSFEIIPDVQQTENSTRLYVADQIREDGNYSLLKGNTPVSEFAFNDNRSESDLTYADNAALKTALAGFKTDILNARKASIKNEVKSANDGTQLWKICLILALLFLAAEILLIRFYKGAGPKLSISR
jgi:hypothetical protein